MSATLTITSPSGAVSAVVIAHDVSGPTRKFGQPAMLVFTLAENYTLYGDFTNANNPLRDNSMTELEFNGNKEFKGYVTLIEKTQTAGGEQALRITCKDRLGKLEKTLAGIGSTLFKAECPTAQLGFDSKGYDTATAIPLLLADQTNGFDPLNSEWPVFPAFSTATDTPDNGSPYGGSPWISKDQMPATTLTVDIDDTSTDPIELDDIDVLTGPGFLQAGDELIQYEILYRASPADATRGFVANISRGALGSTAAAHTATDPVCQRVLKTLSPRVGMQITSGISLLAVAPGDYRPQKDGHIDFSYDPSGLSNLLGYYGVYAEDDADGLTLASLATGMLEFPRAPGGPGLDAGQIDVSGLDFIPIPSYGTDTEANTLPTLQAAIDQVGIDQRGFGAKPIGLYYDSSSDTVVLTSLTQQSTPDVYYRSASDMTEQLSSENLYSAVSVKFTNPDPTLLISTDRMWHKAIGDQFNADAGPDDVNVLKLLYCLQDRQLAANWQQDSTVTHKSAHLSLIVDGQPFTGWGMLFDTGQITHDDEDPAVLLYAWFGAATAVISAVTATFDVRGFVPGGFPGYKIEVVGFDAYTPGSPPTVGDVIPLSEMLSFQVYGGDDTRNSAPPKRWVNISGQGLTEVA